MPKKRVMRGGMKGVTWDFTPIGAVPGTGLQKNYEAEVGSGMNSSVVTAALNWIMRAFPEAPLIVERRKGEQWQEVLDHELATLLRQPNPYYAGRVLWMATAMDFCFGEAFWLKVRNGFGKVTELWWIPRALICPKWDQADPRSYISYYEYKIANRTPIKLPPEDVVHFRFGMDPTNTRRGFSQLAAIFREVYIDDQAANFTAAILKNLGIIGLVFSPTGTAMIPKEQAEKLKDYAGKAFTGEKRAQALVSTGAIDVKLLQYNLQGFDVGPIRDISEERVCAALGVPAAVIGFGTGLQQTKVGATMREMVQLAWRGAIMPNQEIMADELDRSLLPEFQKSTDLFRVKFDTSRVRALWEDELGRSTRIVSQWTSDVITQGEARKELGYPESPDGGDSGMSKKFHHELGAIQAPPSKTPPTDGTPPADDTPPKGAI